MKLSTDRYRYIRLNSCSLFMMLIFIAGCATSPGPVFVQKSVQTSMTLEQEGDIGNAVEGVKIALTIDPNNSSLRDELTRLLVKRDQQAEKHLKAGLGMRTSNPTGARKEFLQALRVRNDYQEALTALRELQLSLSKDIIQGRLKKEAKIAASRADEKERAADEEMSTGDYSLDIAVSALEDGDFPTAIREFEKMKALYPDDPDIQAYLDKSWYNSGKASFIKMEYKKALASFSKVRKGYENVDDYIAKCRQALKKAGSR